MIRVALRHRFPSITLDLGFEAPSTGATALFGPSGAGKSSLVAVIAGLLRPDYGRVELDGDVLSDTGQRLWLAPERRRLGLVFQDARLFPHLSVDTNLRYGLRRARGGEIRFDDVVTLLGIGGLLGRWPHTLSGGERQRVAIGRALLSQPRLLLMDEPLASLDAARKAEILPYLVGLKALGLPMIYVSHVLEEVEVLADTLVLLDRGRIVAAGPLEALAGRGDVPLAARHDAGAVLRVRVAEHDLPRRLTLLAVGELRLWVPLQDLAVGATVRVRVPAREVILATEVPHGISVHNVVQGRVRAITEIAARHAALVEVAVGQIALLALVTPDAVAKLALVPGVPVLALIKSMAVDVLQG
jgi:molybdate transport system ATP-binding protein